MLEIDPVIGVSRNHFLLALFHGILGKWGQLADCRLFNMAFRLRFREPS